MFSVKWFTVTDFLISTVWLIDISRHLCYVPIPYCIQIVDGMYYILIFSVYCFGRKIQESFHANRKLFSISAVNQAAILEHRLNFTKRKPKVCQLFSTYFFVFQDLYGAVSPPFAIYFKFVIENYLSNCSWLSPQDTVAVRLRETYR